MSIRPVLISGFAMFSMFFGSGNVVFPLVAGQQSSGKILISLLGFFLTAVVVPFIGVIGLIKHKGDVDSYFKPLTPVGAFLISAFIYLLVGPFGVVPRCITVSYGGFNLMYNGFELWLFSLIFCISLLFVCWNKEKIVNIIALYLTPAKLGGMLFMVVFCLVVAPKDKAFFIIDVSDRFLNSLRQGYQTMDLLGAMLIPTSIYTYIKNNAPKGIDEKHLVQTGIYSSILGGIILCVVYSCFLVLGAIYAKELSTVGQEKYLAEITRIALGDFALPVISVLLAVSCLATASILTSTWTDFIYKKVFLKKLNYKLLLVLSITVAYVASLLGFKKIVEILGSVLEWLYPLMILYAVFRLFSFKKRYFFSGQKV